MAVSSCVHELMPPSPPPPTLETGGRGLSPLILPHAHTVTLLQHNSIIATKLERVCMSVLE